MIVKQKQKGLVSRLLSDEQGFVWATPTALGLILLISSFGRFIFWLPTLEGAQQIPVSSHLVSLFALPFGVSALMILAAKKRRPGPDWQHSHWKYHMRTLVLGAIGGCAVALIYFPAAYQTAMSLQRLIIGGMVLVGVSALIFWRTLKAIRASERKLPIKV
jgi:phosphoglycerol transferase MdoB-like AlkP superfamily enzyme